MTNTAQNGKGSGADSPEKGRDHKAFRDGWDYWHNPMIEMIPVKECEEKTFKHKREVE